MKNSIIALFLFLGLGSLQSQNWVNIRSNVPVSASKNLVSSDVENSIIHFSLDGYSMKQVQTQNGIANIPTVGEAFPMQIAGTPDLSKLSSSIIIPDEAEMTTEIVSSNYTEYSNIEIAPSKGNLLRNVDPTSIAYNYGKIYQQNQFYPGKLADLTSPYILRDYRGLTVNTYPFQYNPITKVLRVYSDITVKVKSTKAIGTNILTRTKALNKVDSEFNDIYNHQFLNYSTSKYTALAEQGKMLVICYGTYMSAMQPFVDWKNDEGVPTQMVSVTTAGSTAAAIKTYITNYYNTNGLTFVLLVGDAAQVPTFTSAGGGSDPTYGYIVGNDKYQELFIGRFSAESVAQVTLQVNRTISYERNPTTVPGKFNHTVGIGSNDPGVGDNNEHDWEHERLILTNLMGYTYTTESELFDGSQGGLDASGDVTAAMVTAEINNGTGIINYTGHGADTYFVTSGFSNTNCNGLTNTTMWPFIWSVACVNGNFTGTTCLAEALLRANNAGNPTGAVATLMSTINQSWNPPMVGQDEMVNILRESVAGNIKRTFGGLSVNGIFKMNDVSADYDMTDTWHIFGDPSLMVRTTDPISMTVTHAATLPIGSTQLTVNCNANGALACLTINHQIIGTGVISGGVANITFPALVAIDTIKVTVTKFNYMPYQGDVGIISASGPFINYNSHIINDASGNGNSLADFSESILLNVGLKNVGAAGANGISAILSTTNANVTITDNSATYGNIAIGATSMLNGAFAFNVSASTPDQEVVTFDLAITDGTNNWTSSFSVTLNAPNFSVGNMTISDPAPGGNNNGRLDPGETVNLIVQTSNLGHATALSPLAGITSSASDITINSASYNFTNMLAAASGNATFNISVSPSAILGTNVTFNYSINSAAYQALKSFTKTIGIVSEDWETGAFAQFNWTQVGSAPWTITNTLPYEGVDCARSGVIGDNSTSELHLTANVLSPDSISFYKKVSCEYGQASGQWWDFLEFFIDGTSMGKWDGEVAWTREHYYVTSGNHTFKWIYSKDGSATGGSDAAWVDFIVFPPMGAITSVNSIEANTNSSMYCYPNPLKDNATINYNLKENATVSLAIYNSIGQKAIELVNSKSETAGSHSMVFDASKLSAGIYYCKLSTGNELIISKLIVTSK
ncbi:MAG: T9SS type A sorting domain-containing protein [Bacteroidetes bacterium]|nr:T9SS type A sorting domain-containing protein [Bacteroidota bacterium]